MSPLLMLLACPTGSEDDGLHEESLGRVEQLIDEIQATVWPGVVTEDGTRHVRLLNGFHAGDPSSYWFAGFASRVGADVFWFCPEGEEQCPFDEDGVIDRERTIGDPVFRVAPGEWDYSPFWLTWVVRVDDDYNANDLKSVSGIERAAEDGHVEVEPVYFDHGPERGKDLTMMHCLLVLEDTELEGNGDDIIGQPGVPSRYVPIQTGWNNQYQVSFYDFTENEGVFPPAPDTVSQPLFPNADIFVMFRDCNGGSDSYLCESADELLGAVSERGVELDFTNDGDKADNNNIISGFPRVINDDELDLAYSPLWRVMRTRIPVESDGQIWLIDDSGDEFDTEVKDPQTLRALVDQGLLEEPETVSEGEMGNAIPGNNDVLFFNCPSQVPNE